MPEIVSPQRIKVAFDHRVFAVQRFGGVSRYFARLSEHLPEFGVDTKVISPIYISQPLESLPAGRVWGVNVRSSHRLARVAARVAGEVLHNPLAKAYGAQIVHETNWRRRRVAPRGSRIVTTIYDMIAEVLPSYFPGDTVPANKRASIQEREALLSLPQDAEALIAYPGGAVANALLDQVLA